MSEGHSSAERYPIHRVRSEAEIVQDRLNGLMISEALLIQGAIGSVLDKKGAKHFQQMIKRLSDGA